jgi:adenine-specific DNA methylase
MTMTKTAAQTTVVVPFSLRDTPSLIEKAWPTAKISAETQKERKAVHGQTLTGLGSYWKGRKPLILTRACVLAALIPATDNLERDVEIFEKLMGIADETFGRRFVEGSAAFNRLFPDHASQVIDYSGRALRWRDDLSDSERQRRIAKAFMELPYAARLDKVKRPEELAERDLLDGIWDDVNAHLGTKAKSISELVEQLGIMRFGRRPKFADTFSGSGQIPFEAARMGCDVYASDLNPIACMLTWSSFNIVGAIPTKRALMDEERDKVLSQIDDEITTLGVEHEESGNRAKVFLYCIEVRCPRTGFMVPLVPSWVISKKRRVIGELVPDHTQKRYDILIRSYVDEDEMAEADLGTVRNGRVFHPVLDDEIGVSLKEIRGDFTDEAGDNQNLLRRWTKEDFCPREGDVFKERLYAIQWINGDDIKKGKSNPRTSFAAPTPQDEDREQLVRDIVGRNLADWQEQGFVPDMEIEPGNKTDEPIRTRGWTYWHHLFSPRDLLLIHILRKHASNHPDLYPAVCIAANNHSRLARWTFSQSGGDGGTKAVFSNQALNTLLNYAHRGAYGIKEYGSFSSAPVSQAAVSIRQEVAQGIEEEQDIFITDPPYADAVQYDEITEFFIAWLRKNPPAPFNEWIWDSRRNLAIKGEGQSFKIAMVEAYKAMADHTSDNGLQIVQFTHQDAKTWSDMAQIFWGAGLQVVQDWYVSTETMTELKKGGYVQGTHMIILRKRKGEKSGYPDEIVHEIRDEVERQINEMIGLNDQMDAARGENIFNDADLQMAGYAAALRVLTAYTKIDGVDMTREALRPRRKGETTIVDELTEFAVQTANEFLVPEGLERNLWLELNGAERFYLKMTDIEEAGEAKLDQFQNFAKAFRVADYDDMMASKSPNNARLKTATELGKTAMAEGTSFGRDSVVRVALRGVWRIGKEDEAEDVLEELRDLIPDYHRKRDILTQIVGYIAAKREQSHPDEARAARILVTAIQTERI